MTGQLGLQKLTGSENGIRKIGSWLLERITDRGRVEGGRASWTSGRWGWQKELRRQRIGGVASDRRSSFGGEVSNEQFRKRGIAEAGEVPR